MKKITIPLGIMAIVAIAFTLYGFIAKPKVAFVHVQEVYNEFEYKLELEKKFDNVQNVRKRVLDSLEIQINALAANIQNSEINKEQNIQNYQYLAADYQNKQKMFEEDNDRTSKEYTDKIWNQLNKYIEEYGEREGYDFIYGTDGSGSIMYAKKGFNITEEVKQFVNNRYKGADIQ